MARDVAYDWRGVLRVTEDSGKPALRLDGDYDARAARAVREQLMKAGVRLATLINTVTK